MKLVSSLLTSIFAIPPDVIQEAEVALAALVITDLSLPNTPEVKAALVTLLGAVYIVVKSIAKAKGA